MGYSKKKIALMLRIFGVILIILFLYLSYNCFTSSDTTCTVPIFHSKFSLYTIGLSGIFIFILGYFLNEWRSATLKLIYHIVLFILILVIFGLLVPPLIKGTLTRTWLFETPRFIALMGIFSLTVFLYEINKSIEKKLNN